MEIVLDRAAPGAADDESFDIWRDRLAACELDELSSFCTGAFTARPVRPYVGQLGFLLAVKRRFLALAEAPAGRRHAERCAAKAEFIESMIAALHRNRAPFVSDAAAERRPASIRVS